MHVSVLVVFLLVPLCSAQAVGVRSDLLAGLDFRNIGPANMSGRFVDIAVVESDPFVYYAASATGGVFKTTNNGVTFEPVFEREATHSVGDIAVFQENPDIVWVGTGERANRQSSSWGDGIYKSVDAGATWTNLGLRETRHIGRVALHPTDADVVYVAGMGHLWGDNPERGLYKSVDGGETWRKILFIDERTGVVDVVLDPRNPNIVYAAAYQRQRKAFGFHGGGPGSGLYKSTDAGESWQELRNGLPDGDYGRIGISIYRKDPRIVYVCVEQGLRYTASTSYEQRLAGVYRSEDRGESFEHMSDWNPRPMYASQILVDPNDDQRIYMQNAFSFSSDGGKTFTAPRQSIHSDDRHLWVNPNDSRHLIKASDGALATSYDQGETWLLVTSLPVSQYYRVSVDMAVPFNVYGGLQDNGSWVGPSATYRTDGILNEDWTRLGGGDGFLNLVDPTDPSMVYVESQYLGLTHVDMKTNQSRSIRPGNRAQWISSRRNWDVWGTGRPFPPLGNQMSPANWDGPFIVSPHQPSTLYAGTNEVWRSTDRGQTWTSLGDLTTKVDRSTLTIMEQKPVASTPSLDDGIPFWPATTAIAESPLRRGLLYVGTDDGNLAVSADGGRSWEQIASRLPGLPPAGWIAGIEPSRHDENTVYVVANNYRNDDYGNYLFKSTDAGAHFTSITGDLVADRVLRTVREDPRNPDVLWLGAELGLWVSVDGGSRWLELKNNLPTLPINDLLVHPRDNDLVLGTHGRGVWILDSVHAIQELTPEVLAEPAHLFSIEPAAMIRYGRVKAQPGDLVFRGENPPAGAIIDYYLRDDADVELSVHDADGEVRRLEPATGTGVQRVVWDLKYPAPGGDGAPDRRGRGLQGAWVRPGRYEVRLTVGTRTWTRSVEVREDPRLDVVPSERESWLRSVRHIGEMFVTTDGWVRRLPEDDERRQDLQELRRRIRTLYGQVHGWTGALTDDQAAQVAFFSDMMAKLEPRSGGDK